jgi:hypothetical protein
MGTSCRPPHSERLPMVPDIPTLNFAKNAKFRMGHPATSPRAILPPAILAATWPPIPKPALPRRLANVASSPGGRALHGLRSSNWLRCSRRASRTKADGFAWCASRLGRRRVAAFYPARFGRCAYVESVPQYASHRKHFKASCSIPGLSGPAANIPTQAKTGLELATRRHPHSKFRKEREI